MALTQFLGRTILWSLASIAFLYSAYAQEIFSYGNCDLISCPLDCNITLLEGEECPLCRCPLGQRCPYLDCPPEPACLKVQRLDGCLNCACAGATYYSYDETRNVATFATNPSNLINVKETCNLYDIQSVQRCLKDVLAYMKNVERSNSDVIAHPMVAMFLYNRVELLELCNLYYQSLRCVSTDTRQRCFDQERHMHMLISSFDSVCSRQKTVTTSDDVERSLNEYDCVHNILVSHVEADRCTNRMSRGFGKAYKDVESKTAQKRQRKCEGLNEFLDCVAPTVGKFCGVQAAEMFRQVMLNASQAIAPECRTDRNIFVPVNAKA